MSLSVTLSKNSWHYRLQSFVWGDNQPNLFSLCPYFWFTVFTLLISPAYLLVWLIILLIKYCVVIPLGYIVVNYMYQPASFVLEKRTLHWIKSQSIIDVLVQIGYVSGTDLKNLCSGQPSFLGMKLDLDKVVFMLYDYWGREAVQKAMYSSEFELARKESVVAHTKKKWNPTWWKTAVRYTEKIGLIIFASIAVGACTALLALIGYAIYKASWASIFSFVTAVSIMLGSFGFGVLLFMFTKLINRKTKHSRSLLYLYLRNNFKKVCPAIDWKEEQL